ncbi:hypothetical protein [Sphingomonas sp.]|uniref:hypothetical protein n=1 Tax=Sphingomonas sp. TaxID=28214 RepID=UPI0025D83A98|nr:hypothetical protein [Sphingomonas sp.]
MQRRCKWPPKPAEIVEACNEAAERIARFTRYQDWGKKQLAELEKPRQPRPSREELEMRFGGRLLPVDFGMDEAERAALARKPYSPPPFSKIAENYKDNPERMTNLTSAPGKRRSLRQL